MICTTMQGPEHYLPAVREQYERFPYPPRAVEEDARLLRGSYNSYLPMINHYGFGGRRNFFAQPFRALDAGCGTGDTAIFLAEQLRTHSQAEVVALDLSEKSLEVVQARARTRGLANIRFIHASIEDLPKLGLGEFDYVTSCGVIHHLPEPERALNRLAEMLKPDGVLYFMVYAKYGRSGIYSLQDLLRLIAPSEMALEKRVAIAREVVDRLPPESWFWKDGPHWKAEIDQHGDAGIVDLLLHACDYAFTAPDLEAMAERAGLHISEFVCMVRGGNGTYYYMPEAYVARGDSGPLRKLYDLPRSQQREAAELLSGKMIRHDVYCTRTPNGAARFSDPDNVPFFLEFQIEPVLKALDELPAGPVTITKKGEFSVEYYPGALAAKFLRLIDGKRTIGDIVAALQSMEAAGAGNEIAMQLQPDFEFFRGLNYLLLRHRSVPRFKTLREVANLSVILRDTGNSTTV